MDQETEALLPKTWGQAVLKTSTLDFQRDGSGLSEGTKRAGPEAYGAHAAGAPLTAGLQGTELAVSKSHSLPGSLSFWL